MQANRLIILKSGSQHREQQYKQSIKLMENTSNRFNECFLMLGAWQKNNIGELCQYVQEWRLPSSLFLEYNKCPTILKEISNIYFPFLQKLFLRSNSIQSIEVVSQLNMPSLQKIWFGSNQICTIKSLRRAYFPQLQCLTLCCNRLNELQLLDEFYAPFLTDLDLQRSQRDDQNRFVSLKTLIRLQSSCGKINIWALNPCRIKQESMTNCLRRKHQINNIYYPN